MPTPTEIKQWIADAVKWHRHDGVLTQLVYLYNLFGFRQRWSNILDGDYLCFNFAIDTNGTTVRTFNTDTFRIVSIYVISLDTTAATITIKNTGSTVTTIAKGTVSGGMVGAVSLANTDFTSRVSTISVESSSAGNARIMISVLFPNN